MRRMYELLDVTTQQCDIDTMFRLDHSTYIMLKIKYPMKITKDY